jgi:hypothetical protein
MKKTEKKKTREMTALMLMLVLTGFRIDVAAQQISWSAMEDIRQVTELATVSRWETMKQDKGVTLSSRWLSFGDSLRTREIALHFRVDADMERVLDYLTDPEKMNDWNDGVRSLELLEHKGTTWITHTVYDIPYPFAQQDLVVKNTMKQEKQKIIILLSALPGYIQPLKNVTRQQLYFGKWELTTADHTTTEVKFSALSFSRSGIPRFIRDPVIQNKLFQSFSRLKELSSGKPAAVAELGVAKPVP